jgi:RNA polymerase-binding transcription factor DksA
MAGIIGNGNNGDIRAALVKRIEELQRQLGYSTMNLAIPDRVGDTGDQAVREEALHTDLELNVRKADELAAARAALVKWDSGIWGICEACDEAIPEKRLKAVPHARYCVPCQERREKSRREERRSSFKASDLERGAH